MTDNKKRDEKKPAEILIVEDSPTQVMELEYILEQSAYTVYIAHNGVEALELINQHKPEIVISDIVMPRMDGYELCKRIKENASLRGIFVILLTTLSELKDVIGSLQCGADKFLTKPYDEELLLSTIEHLLHNGSLPDSEEAEKVIEVSYEGQKYSIHSSRTQILSLLISTYEAAVKKNTELIKTQEDLRILNKNLEEKVNERTAALQAKNEELNIISQQLWQTSKLATMGELSASIAHELNNPLATVNLRIELLLSQTPQDDEKKRSLEIVEQEVERMGKLVSNLLQFSRRNKQEISTINVCEEIENTLELIYYHFRKNHINVIKRYPQGIRYVHADRQQLRQIFLNLFTNASDAMPEGGTLTIEIKAEGGGQRAEDEKQFDEVRGEGNERREAWFDNIMNSSNRHPVPDLRETFVVIEISDTGVGILPEDIEKVFQPFFTTKPEGKGTGLGLPICNRIVKECHGTLNIESDCGKGTTVRILLPSITGTNGIDPEDD
jgi:two-component system sensor histidine kinase/response regulator